jgi:hypothetical protein
VTEKKPRRKSSRPPPSPEELQRQRDSFVHTFFKRGAEFTDELLRENERIRHQLVELESDNAKLRAQLASDEAIRDLLRTVEQLEREKKTLLGHIRETEALSSRVSARQQEMEDELASLAHLYVATYQLHSTLRLPRVVKHLKDLLQQLVGARDSAFYMATPERDALVRIAFDGLPLGAERIPVGPGDGAGDPLETAYLTGVARIETGALAGASLEQPAAVVPMHFDSQVVGVLVVYRVFEQKDRFVPVDFELFKLLGAHGATALAASLLFHAADGRLPDLAPFRDLLP